MRLLLLCCIVDFVNWGVRPNDIIIDKWGSANTKYYIETEVGVDNIPLQTPKNSGVIRTFSLEESDLLKAEKYNCEASFIDWLESTETKNVNVENWRDRDPYCYGIYNQSLPELYFDFRGANNKTYYLDSVTIETFDYLQPMSGGWVERYASYDVLLQFEKGNSTISIDDNKFKFTNDGTVTLKFWSAHYLQTLKGKSPEPAYYLLSLRFHFSENQEQSLITVDLNNYFLLQV